MAKFPTADKVWAEFLAQDAIFALEVQMFLDGLTDEMPETAPGMSEERANEIVFPEVFTRVA